MINLAAPRATFSLPVLPSVNPNRPPVLGEFSKAVDGSVSINFGLSGGPNCDTACRYHPNTTSSDPLPACYAVRAESRPDRRELKAKLVRHQEHGPAEVATRALQELKQRVESGNPPPWVRISTSGSVPNRMDNEFRKALLSLLDFCDANNLPVHFPVETARKARHYRSAIRSRAVVRESAQDIARFLSATGAVSFVAGDPRMNRRERVQYAKLVASWRTRRTGQKTIVCPSVAARYLRDDNQSVDRAKCGNCTACAKPSVAVVYPLH